MFDIVMGGLKQNRRSDKGLEAYRRALRSPVRGLWQGVIDESQFEEAMLSVIGRGLNRAWIEGAAECGIGPEELTQAEQETLAGRVTEEFGHVGGFGAAIAENSRANGGKLTPLFGRLEMWVNRYRDVINQAKAMACKDGKAIWRIGPTEQHCRSCAGFNGRVYRFSTWESNGAMPQSQNLLCRGFRCLCNLDPTDGPITKGRFPRGLLG